MHTATWSGLFVPAALACAGLWCAALADGTTPAPKGDRQRFEPTWESLRTYTVPEWYKDAKFGIFIHWGVYSVPAFGNEWYPHAMYVKKDKAFEHHRKTWGDQSKFGYKDFIPMFKAEKWDPETWAKLFKEAGAKYVVPVAEHHDGFAMYDSSHTKWNAAKMGPHRDVVGELAKAVRKQGMKLGASSHYAHNWFYYTFEDSFDTVDPNFSALYGTRHGPKEPASKEFLDLWYARVTDIIDKYQPDLLWFDFGFNRKEFEPYRKKMAAYYYNKAIEEGKEVVINYKGGAFPPDAAVLDIERGKLDKAREHFWQTDTSVSYNSWGYVRNQRYKPVNSIIDDLADIVSKNGCLLLNICPKPDGTISEHEQQMLREIGRWLAVNGEAIYGTRPWKTYGEGPTGIPKAFKEDQQSSYTARDIRFTQKGNVLYAIVLDWPGERLSITSLGTESAPGSKIAEVRLLGCDEKLTWNQTTGDLTVVMPKQRPCEHAYSLRIVFRPGP